MSDSQLMQGFPPSLENQVTTENWRTAPYSSWAFRNIRQLLPTAPIHTTRDHEWILPREPQNLTELSFQDIQGKETSLGDFLIDNNVDGFIVLRNGTVVFEYYGHGLLPESPHILFSVSKSMTAILCGVLVDRGFIDPDALIMEYVPEVENSAYEKATVRHLLDMTVGISFDEDYDNETGDFARYRMATGWIPLTEPDAPDNLRSFLPTLKQEGDHGKSFHYVSPNSDLLGWVLERSTGRSFSELFSQLIWQPMGAEYDAYINIDRLGAPRSAGGICVTLRDFGRFGQMCLNSGLANGRSVVPNWWIRDMRQNGDQSAWDAGNFAEFMPNWRYRSKWYISSAGVYAGLGVFGQFLYIDPAADVVIARFSSRPKALDPADKDSSFLAYEAICQSVNH